MLKGKFRAGSGSAGLFFPGQLPQAGEIWVICEGVKDAAAYHGLDFLACGLNRDEMAVRYSRLFDSVDVIVMPDRTIAAEQKAFTTAARLYGKATSVKIGMLPLAIGESEGYDARDVLRKSDGEKLLRQAIEDATHWHPPSAESDDGEPNIMQPQDRTDAGNARRLLCQHRDDIRWCDPLGKWLVWDRKRWRIGDERRVDSLAKKVAARLWQEVAEAAPNAEPQTVDAMMRFAKSSNSKNGIGNMIALARSGRPILADKLDCDPWLLNVANGTLDLRTETLRQHRKNGYITKLCPVEFDPDAQCPTWRQFVQDVTDHNQALITYLQRTVGYCLTGLTREHILLFLYGKGANGKSTFVNTLLALHGEDYAIKAPTALLLVKRDQHPTEKADLFGKRIVACVEADNGRRLAESLVKELTGGDKVRARRMREDFWEFSATHKIWLAANHKPVVRGTDHGIWRQIKLIPFTVVIPDEQQDKTLSDKLIAELSGILQWALAGCKEWQNAGLGEPDEVKAATGDYRAEMDIIGRFIREECVTGNQLYVGATTLYEAFKTWGGTATQRSFCGDLGNREFESDRFTAGPKKGCKMWRGIGLAEPYEASEQCEQSLWFAATDDLPL